MSKNIENTKIKKLPTSQLIFYMSSSKLGDENLKIRIEETIFSRLTKGYKLYPDMARKLVERDQEVISIRGNDIESYTFGKDMSYDELFRVFYECGQFIPTRVGEEKGPNTLTMSEIVEFEKWVSFYLSKFKVRQKMFQRGIKNNEIDQKRILSSDGIPFDAKEKEINKLKELREIMQLQSENEEFLIKYNDILFQRILNELRKIIEYDESQFFRMFLTISKEIILLNSHPKSPLRKQEDERLSDINFDAYTHFTAIPSEYGAFPFSKKR